MYYSHIYIRVSTARLFCLFLQYLLFIVQESCKLSFHHLSFLLSVFYPPPFLLINHICVFYLGRYIDPCNSLTAIPSNSPSIDLCAFLSLSSTDYDNYHVSQPDVKVRTIHSLYNLYFLHIGSVCFFIKFLFLFNTF